MALSAVRIAEAVFAIESKLDLEAPTWQQADVHWWPLYRTELYRLLVVAAAGDGNRSRPPLGPAWKSAHCETPRSAPGAVWLVSDGISYTNVGNRIIERFCGPLWAQCRSLGVSALVVDRGREHVPAASEPTRWIAPWTLRAKIHATLAARLAPDRRHRQLVDSVLQAARACSVALMGLNAQRMQSLAGAVEGLARRIEPCLRNELVRALFVVGFYDVSGYACTLAAARAGIPSVDVQHGVTGDYHLAYASWPQRRQPWRLLPHWFWTWTQADADVVTRWSHNSAHAALCGGHPFLDAWRDGLLRLDARQQLLLDALLTRAAGRKAVLVTLQPQVAHFDALRPLLEAMRQCHQAFWWLRLHPMALADRANIEALLGSYGLRDYEIDSSTALPLPALLARASIHATHSSSTFIEAAAFGVPSIMWSRYGAELAEKSLVDGTAHLAMDGTTFARLIETSARASTPAHHHATASSAHALRQILEIAA